MSNLDKARNFSGQKGKAGAYMNHGNAFGGCWSEQSLSKVFSSVRATKQVLDVMGSLKGYGKKSN